MGAQNHKSIQNEGTLSIAAEKPSRHSSSKIVPTHSVPLFGTGLHEGLFGLYCELQNRHL